MNNLCLTVVVAARQWNTGATTITTTSPRLIDNVAEVSATIVQCLIIDEVFVVALNKNGLPCHVLS